MVTSVPASMLIAEVASHSHAHTNSHPLPRAPSRSTRPWHAALPHSKSAHDDATAAHAAERRQSRLDFQTERHDSASERRLEGESLNQRMLDGRGDAADHSSEARVNASGSCSSPSSLDALPVSPLPFDALHRSVSRGREGAEGDGMTGGWLAGERGGGEVERLPGAKALFGQRGWARRWRSAKDLRGADADDRAGDAGLGVSRSVSLTLENGASPAATPLKARQLFPWAKKSASSSALVLGRGDGSSSRGSSSGSSSSRRRVGLKKVKARAALQEYMNAPMPPRPSQRRDSEPPDADRMGTRRWWQQQPCVVLFWWAVAAARHVRIPIIHPYSRFRRDVNLVWEVLYMVAFDLRATGVWLILDSCLSVVYLADVLLGFKTGYLTREKHIVAEGGIKVLLPQQIVMDQRRIIWHYLRSWFLVDLLSSLPIDLITSSLAQSNVGFWLSAALRLLKLLRLRRLGQATQQLRQSAIAGLYMEMSILVLQICMVCHVGACAFALIGRLESPPESWLAAFYWSNGGSQETLESAPHGVVYAAAYYWAMVTFASVGYGDIHPVDTLAERVFATVYILVTSILLGYAIGQISSLIYASRAHRESVRQRCNTLHKFIEKEEIPDWLANRLMVSLTGKWQSELSQRFHEGDLVDALTDDLRADLFVHWWQRHVLPSPIFPHSPSFLAHVFPCLIVRRVAPADVIASEGEFSRHVYVVRSGTVDVTRIVDGQPGAPGGIDADGTGALAELAGHEADVEGRAMEMGAEEVQLPASVVRALQQHGGTLGRSSMSIPAAGVRGALGGAVGGVGAAGGPGVGFLQKRAMRRSLAVQDTLPGALEMRRGEETWSGQRVSVICMEASFQAKTECEVYLLLVDDLFDALESFPELLTAMRTELSLPWPPTSACRARAACTARAASRACAARAAAAPRPSRQMPPPARPSRLAKDGS
ncbi:hypothetical protein CLOP_g11745 [Closterium sp. NIES-67]|nr:hypothetical protein CLOP_g11745 [Closterium sp. NIES-67]